MLLAIILLTEKWAGAAILKSKELYLGDKPKRCNPTTNLWWDLVPKLFSYGYLRKLSEHPNKNNYEKEVHKKHQVNILVLVYYGQHIKCDIQLKYVL